MDDLIAAMETALADFSARRVAQPLRTVLEVGDGQAFYGVMPAYLPAAPALGTKLVTVFGNNAALGLPTHLALVVLLDPQTGALLALMDGRYITEARTAAVSAVSVDHLARDDSRTLAIIGAGVQARSHLEAIGRVRDLAEVRVWSRTRARGESFLTEMQPHSTARIMLAESAEAAVRDADLVVLATSAREPVVQADWIAEGTHVCAVGACRPTHREMDAALVARGRLYVDSREGALAEAGDVVLDIREGAIHEGHIQAELGEVVASSRKRRRSPREVTIFKSLGMAVEDVAAADLVYRRASEGMIGTRVQL
jgi:alanine dehydrogenase